MTDEEINAEAARIIETAQVPLLRAMQVYGEICALVQRAMREVPPVEVRRKNKWRSEESRLKMIELGKRNAARLNEVRWGQQQNKGDA